MLKAPILSGEEKRLESLHELMMLDTPSEPRFDKITADIAGKLNVPICTVSLVDNDREWFKSNFGYPGAEGNRSTSFCGHAMYAKNIFIIEDTLKDSRFADNPSVIDEPHIRFYAGLALYNRKTKDPIGAFCVKDYKPRTLTLEEIDLLITAAEKVEEELNSKTDVKIITHYS